MSFQSVFLLLGFALLGGLLVAVVCSSIYPEAQRGVREWINTAISIVTLVVLAWTANSIVDQVTEMRKVYPQIQNQSKAMADQVDSFVATERARVFLLPNNVQRTGDKDPNPKFSYTIANMGRTSAFVTGIFIQCDVSSNQINPTPSYDKTGPYPAAYIMAGGTLRQNDTGLECTLSRPLTEDDFAGLAAKTKAILFKGYVIYQDVLGQTWKKHFGMYGFGDAKFFNVENDAYNAEEKVKLDKTVLTSAPP
jgi:hypothetical protein